MKQTYVKPRMIVERFALTQSIASGCGVAPGGGTLGVPAHYNKNTCAWDVGGILLFIDANICTDMQVGENDQVMGYCYNNPEGGTAIFSSF